MNLNDYHLWTALVTPLTPGLRVDFESLKNLIKEQDDAKNGLLILGSTGEALNLDLETRKTIVEFALEQKPNSPIMVGVGGHDLPAQRAWISWLETKNINAYLMVTPIYSKPNDKGQYIWFKTLMDSVTKPVMLYNVPGRAGTRLSLNAVKQLSSHKNFWGIKDAGGTVAGLKEYIAAAPNGKIYCGDDGLMPEFAAAGSCGLVSVASNTWPSETHLYVHHCLKGTLKEATMWNTAANSLFIASNPIPAKALLSDEKRIHHNTMMPPLCADDLKGIDLLRVQNNNIKNWFKNNK